MEKRHVADNTIQELWDSFFDQAESRPEESDFDFDSQMPTECGEFDGEDDFDFGAQDEFIQDNELDDFFEGSAHQIGHCICSEYFSDFSELSPTPSFKDVSSIKKQVSDQWLEILRNLAPALEEAIVNKGKHVPCPMHGGRDGFRLFNDADTTGGGVCNTCGFFSDGFSLLHAIHGWPFPETLRRVAQWLDDHVDDKGAR